jgi:hypothetical protein
MKKLKKLLALLLSVVMLLSLCACESDDDDDDDDRRKTSKKPSKDTTLAGQWIYQQEDFESTFTINEDGDKQTVTWKILNYAEEYWEEQVFEVQKIENFTMVALLEDGSIENISFAASGDTLYINGIPHTNPDKDIPLTKDQKTYAFGKDETLVPVYGSVFLGMTYDEVAMFTHGKLEGLSDAAEYQQRSGIYYECNNWKLPSPYEEQYNGWIDYYFDEDEKLIGCEFVLSSFAGIYEQDDIVHKFNTGTNALYGNYSSRESSYDYDDGSSHHSTYYTWKSGKVEIEVYQSVTESAAGVKTPAYLHFTYLLQN